MFNGGGYSVMALGLILQVLYLGLEALLVRGPIRELLSRTPPSRRVFRRSWMALAVGFWGQAALLLSLLLTERNLLAVSGLMFAAAAAAGLDRIEWCSDRVIRRTVLSRREILLANISGVKDVPSWPEEYGESSRSILLVVTDERNVNLMGFESRELLADLLGSSGVEVQSRPHFVRRAKRSDKTALLIGLALLACVNVAAFVAVRLGMLIPLHPLYQGHQTATGGPDD